MDTSLLVALVGLATSLGGIIIAQRYTARTARAAQASTAAIETRKLDVTSWQAQVEAWRADVKQLRELRAEDKAEHEAEMARMQERIDGLDTKLRDASRERVRDRANMDALIAWARVVVGLLRQAELVFPAPPPGVTDTDPGIPAFREV